MLALIHLGERRRAGVKNLFGRTLIQRLRRVSAHLTSVSGRSAIGGDVHGMHPVNSFSHEAQSLAGQFRLHCF